MANLFGQQNGFAGLGGMGTFGNSIGNFVGNNNNMAGNLGGTSLGGGNQNTAALLQQLLSQQNNGGGVSISNTPGMGGHDNSNSTTSVLAQVHRQQQFSFNGQGDNGHIQHFGVNKRNFGDMSGNENDDDGPSKKISL